MLAYHGAVPWPALFQARAFGITSSVAVGDGAMVLIALLALVTRQLIKTQR